MRVSDTARYDCGRDRFWEVYLDPEFTRRMHAEALGSTSVEIVALEGDRRHGIVRTLRYSQQPAMPGPVKRIFGAEVTMTEEGRYDPVSSTWTFTLVPGAVAGRTSISGSVRVEDLAGGGCEERFELDAVVRILGAGPVAERFIAHQARQSHAQSVAFLRAELGDGAPS